VEVGNDVACGCRLGAGRTAHYFDGMKRWRWQHVLNQDALQKNEQMLLVDEKKARFAAGFVSM
jgi:hypothetical protein